MKWTSGFIHLESGTKEPGFFKITIMYFYLAISVLIKLSKKS